MSAHDTAMKAATESLASFGFLVTRERIKLPVGDREVLIVMSATTDPTFVAVHPKDKPSLYRKTGKLQHGIREDLLVYYANRGFLLCVYEEDTGTVLCEEASKLYRLSRISAMPGAFQGPNETSRFFHRDDMVVLRGGA